ncbi:NHL repeat protein [Legionella nautarum]|uniref:NHL repeat protein n=1 Tax=Legionella nautarum TaxID=45070 RepID=A0A0W0WL12_9GAMM|nr:hypothetical protein [Legionella nautarum]KTD32947.1 NHL repeat protein [Legionella nautarum]
MKLLRLLPRLGLSLICLSFFTVSEAGVPLWTFTPVPQFPPKINLSPTGTATIKYLVTNQSKKSHTLVMQAIPGITQISSGFGVCGSSFSLGYQQSCTLVLQVDGSDIADTVTGGPVVCSQGNPLQCYQPNAADILNITRGEATRLYVNGSNLVNGNGTSWATAFNNLQSALEAAQFSTIAVEIWVATGVYKPSKIYAPQGVVGGSYGIATPKLRTFNLPSNTAIFGGFLGNETRREERNGLLNPTILCGDMTSNCLTPYTPASDNDRVWHVLIAGDDLLPGTGVKNVKLDSLIVRGGYANGPDSGVLGVNNVLLSLNYAHDAGGGLLARYGSTVNLNRVVFELNASNGSRATVTELLLGELLVLVSGGGAVAATEPGTLITVSNSRFLNNISLFPGASGGALTAMIGASYTINASQFDNNAAFRNGGAIRAKDAANLSITSSSFTNNALIGPVPDASGGAIGIINSNLSVSNSSFTQNKTTATGFGGGAIFFHTPFNDGTPHFLTVTSSKFTNNLGAAFGGGGINVFGILPNSGTQALISNSEFTSNFGGVGGAIYLDSIPTTVMQCTFFANKAQLEGGAIFDSNFGNSIFGVPLSPQSQIINNIFSNNAIVGVPAGITSPVFFFNLVANGFTNNASSVSSMAPGGGAIAVEFSGNAKISSNAFTANTALGASPADPNRGGAILVGGVVGIPVATELANACLAANLFTGNKADINDDVSVYNPANIPGGVAVSLCPVPVKAA